jgi:hypothetical protein
LLQIVKRSWLRSGPLKLTRRIPDSNWDTSSTIQISEVVGCDAFHFGEGNQIGGTKSSGNADVNQAKIEHKNGGLKLQATFTTTFRSWQEFQKLDYSPQFYPL